MIPDPTFRQLEKQCEQLEIQLTAFEGTVPDKKNESNVLHIKEKAEEIFNFILGGHSETLLGRVLTINERAQALLEEINAIASRANVAPAAPSSAAVPARVSSELSVEIDYKRVIDKLEFDILKTQDQSGQPQTVVPGSRNPAGTLIMFEYKDGYRFGTLIDGHPDINNDGRYCVVAFDNISGQPDVHWHRPKNLYLVKAEEEHRAALRPVAAARVIAAQVPAVQVPAALPASNPFAPVARDEITSAKILDPSSLFFPMITEHLEELNDALAIVDVRDVQTIEDHQILAVMVCYLSAERAVHEIVPGLFLGGGNYTPTAHHIYHYDGSRGPVTFDQVICATRDRPTGYFTPARGTDVYDVPSDPSRSPPDVTLDSLKDNNQADLNAAIRTLDESLKRGRRTFVYCSQGKDRSASIVIGYLMSKYNLSYDQALTFVRSKRYIVDPSPAYVEFFEKDFKKLDLGDNQI